MKLFEKLYSVWQRRVSRKKPESIPLAIPLLDHPDKLVGRAAHVLRRADEPIEHGFQLGSPTLRELCVGKLCNEAAAPRACRDEAVGLKRFPCAANGYNAHPKLLCRRSDGRKRSPPRHTAGEYLRGYPIGDLPVRGADVFGQKRYVHQRSTFSKLRMDALSETRVTAANTAAQTAMVISWTPISYPEEGNTSRCSAAHFMK